MNERIRVDVYRSLGTVMVRATDLITGEWSHATGLDEAEVKAKALERVRRLNEYKSVHPNSPEGMVQ